MSDPYGQLLVLLGAHQRTAQFGFVVPVVTREAVNELNVKIRNFKIDVMAATIPGDSQAAVGQRLKLFSFQRGVTNFKSRWDVWRREHEGSFARTGHDPMREFEEFRIEYNDLVESFKSSFGADKTTARGIEKPSTHANVEKAIGTLNTLAIAAVIAAAAYAVSQVKK